MHASREQTDTRGASAATDEAFIDRQHARLIDGQDAVVNQFECELTRAASLELIVNFHRHRRGSVFGRTAVRYLGLTGHLGNLADNIGAHRRRLTIEAEWAERK